MRAILLAGGFGLVFSLLGTRVAIRQFTRLGYGQEVREDGPTSHHTKRGTPTMGGVAIIVATVLGYFLAKLITQTVPSASAMLLLLVFVGTGMVGFLDDFIKIYKQRSLGLRSKAKIIGQTVVVLTNLEPRQLKGITSQGMLLAAGENAALLRPIAEVAPGTKIK